MQKEYSNLLKEFKQFYKQDKKYFAAIADCYYRMGKYSKAEKIILDNIVDFLDYTTPLYIYAKLLYTQKSYEKARTTVLDALKINDKSVKGQELLAKIELMLDNDFHKSPISKPEPETDEPVEMTVEENDNEDDESMVPEIEGIAEKELFSEPVEAESDSTSEPDIEKKY